MHFTFDTSAWLTYFTNAIIPDYDTHPNQIIYSNLEGYSIPKGLVLMQMLFFKLVLEPL